jgi:hypothetical protein
LIGAALLMTIVARARVLDSGPPGDESRPDESHCAMNE